MKRLNSKIFLIDIDMFFSSTKPMKDSSGMTLVMLAAAGGQDDLLRLLIRKGAKVNGRQKNGTTALIHAAEKVGISFLVCGNSCLWTRTESVSVVKYNSHIVT